MSVAGGERRIVSVLVADVADSTPIGEKLGPERSKFLFDEVVRLMREEVERFGGIVAQLTGDGVLALFGAPVAHEDDSERAVRAAFAIHEAVARYGTEVASAYGFDLRVRVAVNTGPVVVPTREAPVDELFNALGDTVNVAARLQPLGEVVVGPATARQVGGLFELDALGDLELKGKSETVAAFRVVGLRAHPATRPEPALVGRSADLAALGDVLDRLFEGRGGIVSITGEPGIGKSRLVAEVGKRFAGRVRFLAGHAVSYAETIPYWPVRELLRAWLGLGVSEPEARVRLELRAELARTLAEDADEAYPFLATLLGLTLEPEQEQRLADFARDAVQRQTFDWLYRIVVLLAGERPLCLVLDDLHWSDDATLAVLEELLPAAEQTDVAFVLIHRSDPDHPAWQLVDRARRRFRRLFVDLELEPLDAADARALAESDAGGELPDELAQLLGERTGGNPYFVGEAIRDLRERGALEHENGRVLVVGDAYVPAAIQEALQARLDRLDLDARELLTTAAVVGRSFGLPLLERLLPRARLRPTLSELQWLQLVVEERGGAAPEYRFRHGLVQEVAYGTLLEARRRELHLRVGEVLVELHRVSPAEVYGLLAHHFAEADDAERAAEYLLRAGDAARAAYANEEAIALYRRALAFMRRTGDEAHARETLLKIALAHHLAFDYPAANAAFGEAFDLPVPDVAQAQPTERLAYLTGIPWSSEPLAPGLTHSDMTIQVVHNLFRGLVAIGADFEIEPAVAERFAVSDDGRSYRFTLRPDARWSDGVAVTAGDFAFALAQAGEEVKSASSLDRATAIDERTLELRLHEPRNHFLYMLAQPGLFAWPQHVCERDGSDWHRAVPLVGNGPFVLTERLSPWDGHVPGRLTLEAAPTWNGTRGNVAEVTIALEQFAAGAARWRNGEYDLMYDAFAGNARMDATDAAVVERHPGGGTSYVGFDANREPLDDPRIRRALAHAIDRRGSTDASEGGIAAAAGGLLPPAMPGHSHRVAPAYDLEAARALLRDAGHPDGRGLAAIDFAYFADAERTVAPIADQLEAVGIRVRHLPADSYAELEATIQGGAHAYQWFCGTYFPDPGSGFLEPLLLWGTWLYRDERLDALLARATGARDQDERLRACREFERIWIGEQAAVVPLAYADRSLWRRPWVTGMWAHAIARSTFAEAVVNPDLRSPPARG